MAKTKPVGVVFKAKTPLSYLDLQAKLITLNYRRCQLVIAPGEFAVRGAIVDIFPVGHSHPVRLEYDGDDQLERFFSFNVHRQRSLSALETVTLFPFEGGFQDEALEIADEVAESLLSTIAPGDFVVHEKYGIGQFQGLKRLKVGDKEGEFLFVKYAGDDKLYVPLDQLQWIHRYSAADVVPQLHHLSDGLWRKTTAKVKKELLVMADDLVALYHQRATIGGFPFREDTVEQLNFENEFPFAPTPDQMRSVREIKKDMESGLPMDRVLCGDVGYGKTEVVVRAAFKACENLKQVVVLCPTTLLAHQHGEVFAKRFVNTPYKIAVMSRFKTSSQQRHILEDLKAQRLDIVVGTHRLLQADVNLLDLGLLVIDEEQRFGVDQKERMKKKFPGVDVLSVSATPIPRTLYMALTGARDFSTITTPPVLKRPVLTHVMAYDGAKVTQAITEELARGGQVFYVYNKVQSMSRKLASLQAMMPQVRFLMAHGQMAEGVLEKTMVEFWEKRADVLICSTIIENGIDMPNVNTIILEDADHFGLSQIHQLRGRVGRGAHQGVAYLLYSDKDSLSEVGQQRLQAIKSYVALGAGYKLAMKDLEIRGAGTLLGHRQSGHLTQIGFELYCKLLSDMVTSKKTGRPVVAPYNPLHALPDTHAFIPDDYIYDDQERLAVYQRLTQLHDRDAMLDLREELLDRYGPMPLYLGRFFQNVFDQN